MRLNNTKRLVSLFLLVLAVTSPVSAQSVDDFDDISAQMESTGTLRSPLLIFGYFQST